MSRYIHSSDRSGQGNTNVTPDKLRLEIPDEAWFLQMSKPVFSVWAPEVWSGDQRYVSTMQYQVEDSLWLVASLNDGHVEFFLTYQLACEALVVAHRDNYGRLAMKALGL